MAALLVAWASASVAAEDLNVGDPAPKLAVKEFIKGEPIAKLEKGKTYVVEFWATWCGPCRMTIPHLTDLQKRYQDVTFIGVSILEKEPKNVKPFVAAMGDRMAYRVAVDDVPEGSEPEEGAMAKTWWTAATQEGIPTAFVVNGDGKIAWIGNPIEIDKPLADIAAGKWDLKAASAQFQREYGPKRKFLAVRPKLQEAAESGDVKNVLKVIDEVTAQDQDLELMLGATKYLILTGKDGDPVKAEQYGKRLLDTVLKDNPRGLDNLAWSIVRPDKPVPHDAKVIQVALAAAQRADALSKGKDLIIVDTLARAYFVSGDPAKALECQQRALKLARGTRVEQDKAMLQRLEEYKKAVEKSAGQGGQR
jgi:thiol-disulfide isomerase/thioredoxin